MIDPLTSLSLTLHSNRGAYAFLLGSGVSRAAGILTGWEILLDLIRRLAVVHGEECEPYPEQWFTNKFGEEPHYSKLLASVAKTAAERNQLLRSYFEPTEEEQEKGLKTPTPAHKAVANLVRAGFVRVVLTTNFDRLLEKALEEIGIVPTVISTPDQAEGALPLVHTQCMVLKVHGDYRDTRIKNSPEELAEYHPNMNGLLDRILDEFGLVVCGWSAEWDTALRAALERCKSHRFSTFWTTREKPADIAARIINARRAETVCIKDADSFLTELQHRVTALQDLAEPHPIAPKVAVARLKRYLQETNRAISLRDLVMAETDRVCVEFSREGFSAKGVAWSAEEFMRRVNRYDAITKTLQALFITGCYWGNTQHRAVWIDALDRVTNSRNMGDGLVVWLKLGLYPPLLLLYAGGLGAIAGANYVSLHAIFTGPQPRDLNRISDQPFLRFVNVWDVMAGDLAKQLPNMQQRRTPLSDYLHEFFKEPMAEYLSVVEHYTDLFDRLEYFLALCFADSGASTLNPNWVPIGRFGWRNRDIRDVVSKEADKDGSSWAPLRAGFFGGLLEKYQAARDRVDTTLARFPAW